MIALLALALASQTVEAMRDARRVLIVAAPGENDPARLRQETLLASADRMLGDRDVSIVRVTGSVVSGAQDTADTLRRRWHLPVDGFTVVLIGKDGHEALRRTAPVDPVTLTAAIDAMPMRRAGLR